MPNVFHSTFLALYEYEDQVLFWQCPVILESSTDLIYLTDYETGPSLQVFYAFAEHSTTVLLIHLAIGNPTLKFHPQTPNKELTKKLVILAYLFNLI